MRSNWPAERIARADRATVYSVATAARMGREDLAEIRYAAAIEDDRDPIVRLARWFDDATYPLPAPLKVADALALVDDLDLPADVVRAFREVQPIIQPVGLE